MVLLDGRSLAEKIIAELREEYRKILRRISLGAVVVGSDPVIAKFVAQKKKIAGELGVDFRMYEYRADISTNDLRANMAALAHQADLDGIIVQLPLPQGINAQSILNAVPAEKDVDVLSARAVGDFAVGKSLVLPPVVGAVKALLAEYGFSIAGQHIVILGAGRLVGKPIAIWLLNEKASFSVVEEAARDISGFTERADILISGVGKPGLVSADMIKEGAVIIDAGTSESGGKLVGDVDFKNVSQKAAFITPVPGGVGPLTVAMIYKNLLTLAKHR